MKEIRVSVSNSGYNAAFIVDGQPDPEIVELFKTHVIPTAFTKRASAREVITKLEDLNPGYIVSLQSTEEGGN